MTFQIIIVKQVKKYIAVPILKIVAITSEKLNLPIFVSQSENDLLISCFSIYCAHGLQNRHHLNYLYLCIYLTIGNVFFSRDVELGIRRFLGLESWELDSLTILGTKSWELSDKSFDSGMLSRELGVGGSAIFGAWQLGVRLPNNFRYWESMKNLSTPHPFFSRKKMYFSFKGIYFTQ